MTQKIDKILIANRGEIAVRIIRSAQNLGIQTVAIYSTPDRMSPAVQLADEAYHLPGTTAADTYLRMDAILDIAINARVDAIHPGYGFLSENALFAQKVVDRGILFIGPSATSIQLMGDKIAAKEAVKKFDVPLVPGTDFAITDRDQAKTIAQEIGYPVLIKAAAGGGGKGMRRVYIESEFEEAFKRAVSEATASFGDGSVFIERYIQNPKHIEVQILADAHGGVIHLYERECSIQRRHQKVIEEAPSPSIDEDLRQQLGDSAVKVAQAAKYLGAGTVEFILDEQHQFFFLEMNTRLQVEHPVTEFITGLDLVAQQIAIAEGQTIMSQEEVSRKGHAIELRVYAEDPQDNFSPTPGTIDLYQKPNLEHVRVDDGVQEGSEISIYYDPMISKLISYGHDRTQAIQRLITAIRSYRIEGVKTTLPFGLFVLQHPQFVDSSFTTHFVADHFSAELLEDDDATLSGLIAAYLYQEEYRKLRLPQ